LRQAYDYWQDQPGNYCNERSKGISQGEAYLNLIYPPARSIEAPKH